MKAALAVMMAVVVSGCDLFTDAATRLGGELRAASRQLGPDGAAMTLHHEPSCGKEAEGGSYTVQLDHVGALVIWCRDASGEVISSPGTSSHGRFVETPQTYYLKKAVGEALAIDLERIDGRAVITNVR